MSRLLWLALLASSLWPSIEGGREEVVRIDSSQDHLLDEPEEEDSGGDQRYREFSAGKGEKGLFPSIFNLATHAEIRATATCGQNGPDYYCKLVEHVFLRQPQCDICDANNHHKNHPIDYAIDGTRRWWQSPTLSNGLSYERVNITLDLRQVYQVAYVIVKAAISPRPGSWVLEKSLDGVEFKPWQFFAAADSECMRVFGLPASTGVPRFSRDDEVMCTSYFSKLNPLEFGEIHISLVNGRPGAEKSSQSLQDFTKARFVRLRLLGLKTLYADLMVINKRDSKLDHSVTRRYFYTVSDISIGGQCICYGHAERCTPDVVDGQFRCECRHNTCGESCSQCCPLFNQLPWKVGTHEHPNVCQPCQCFNHAHRCEYDPEVERQRQSVTPEGIYEGGGRCVECQHSTEGVNCEKCKPEFYRPANISHYRHDACRPCDCDPLGSEGNECVRDETEALDGLRPGDCRCKAGFGGRRCERCALGFRNHPICEPCPCHQAGSLNFETCQEEQCLCKPNVEGVHCERCKPGTIYLDRENPLGCQPCFCFGKSTECREFAWSTGQISHSTGWNLTDLQGTLQVPQEQGPVSGEERADLLVFNAEDHRDVQPPLYYWKAPAPFLGNRLNSFGSSLHYFVYFVPQDPAQGQQTPIADVVIEGNGAKLEFYSRLNFFPRENISVNVPLKPTDNWYDARTRRPVDKAALMRVLADVTALWLRARYHQDQLQSSIYGLRLETAFDPSQGGEQPEVVEKQRNGNGRKAPHPVEVCACPEHFLGNSCERCEPGFRRVNSQLYDGTCRRCECQEHSEECDPFSGHCLQCRHNTTGLRCELCQPGFFGNPSLGGLLGQCRPCACPTVAHSRSPECALSQLVLDGAAAAGQDEYVCTACEPGYDGNKCETCADGYFGDPFASDPAEACRPCECSGNIDPAAIGNCDRETGECLRCVGHTSGPECEQCLENHWGSALLHTCRPCRCHQIGAITPQCSNGTGQCQCHPGYTGERCDRCEFGHGDVENGCPECQCNSTGSLGLACDEVSGQCVCKKGVYGKRCDMCVPSYYNFGPEGCQFCHCNEFGAIDGRECHNVTGECQCQPHVQGIKCEQCEQGFFNLSSAQGCQPCLCDSTGAIEGSCEERSGQCRCKSGVAGLKCDKCEPNYYGFGEEGCKQCRVCPAIGQVCDSLTGECVCPPNTQGEMCEHCTRNAWNYHPYRGCQLCECDGIGADSQICDERSGQCKCKPGYVGHRCDLCEPGFYSFPECESCECDLAGTELGECRGPVCLCSNDGQCRCRKNIRGQKCDQCVENAFSLEAWNPLGCTECFCFGRASRCQQAPALVWRQTYAPDRRVLFEAPFDMYERRHNLHVLREFPADYNSYPTNHTPLYWPMPDSFKRDRTASYNGFLRFRIRNVDNRRGRPNLQPDAHTFRLFPQVVLIGNTRIELEHVPEKLGGEEGKYKVRLHESQWRNRISPQVPVTRKQMMVALLSVQHIFIRATYNDMFRGDELTISEVSLDVAVEGGAPGDAPALGVEQCLDCAEGWTGRSCQTPAPGFHIFFQEGYLNMPDDIVLAGMVKPCACHGHSGACDPKTGECTECQHNAIGAHCERCRDGFYGNALSGSPDACHRCACPLPDNSFSPTCRSSPSSGRGYVCDACRPGYAGDYCDSCEPGYFGNPSLARGFCAPCACHPHGSLSAVCHNVTGQCQCRQGVDGRDCSLCSPRHAFLEGVCSSISACDRGCYRELMRLEDEMEYAIGPVQSLLSEARPIPRKRLARISTAVATLDSLLDSIGTGGNGLGPEELLFPEEDGIGTDEIPPLRQARLLSQEFQLLQERNNDSLAKLRGLEGELGALRGRVQAENRRVVDIVNQLANFARRSSQTAPGQVNYLLGQAESLLASTRSRVAAIEKKYNYAKKNAEDADRLLKEIMAKKLNSTSYAHLAERQQQLQTLLRDFRDAIWDRARAGSLAAKSLGQMAKGELERLEKTIQDIGQFDELSREELQNGRQNVGQIRGLGEEMAGIQKELADVLLPAARSQRAESLQPVEEEQNSLEELRRSRMSEADQHARELEQQANRLKGRFAETKVFSMDALAASNAYESIVLALQDATSAANAARRNAEEAFAVVDPQREDSLATLANVSATKSAELNRKVDEALESLGVREQNSRLDRTLEEMGQRMGQAQRNMSQVKDVQQLLEDHHDRINTVYSAVDEAHTGLGEIEERLTEFNDAVSELKQRADTVQQFTSSSIQEGIRNLTRSAGELGELEQAFEQLGARTDEHVAQFRQVRADLGVLKEKINEAREKASKVRVGVRAEPGSQCVREFVSPMRPSPSNTILLKYRPGMDTPDSLLFFTQVPGTRTQSREFLAVELRQKKIYVHWDIGGGKRTAAIVKRNIVYIPASDRYTWYHIEVKRVANTMQVSVVQRQTQGGEGSRDVDEPSQVVVGEPKALSEVMFNVVPGQTRLSLGLKDPELAKELGLVTHQFHGTVGELNVDSVNVPLWVFASSEGACEGATGPPAKMASGHMFRNGFAQVRMPMAERTSTMLTVQFSAYSPNGLLYFRGSAQTGEFLALELNEGAVAVKADFGPEAKIALQSNGSKYADGRAHKVRVIRKDGEVHLQIDPEADHVSIALADGQALLDIAEPEHFVGGVPPDFARDEFTQDHDIHFDGFFGCIHSVRPNQVSELDLDNPQRAQRKEAGCRYREERLSTAERVVGFQGIPNGFLKTRGILLDMDSSFSFNFRTLSPNALLLYQSAELQREEQAQKARRRRRRRLMGGGRGKAEFLSLLEGRGRRAAVDSEEQSFLAIYLIQGRLTVHLGTDSRERAKSPLLSSAQTYNDGLLHSMFISRRGKEVQVRVDDREVLATVLLDEQQPIGGEHWVMLLGGVPQRVAKMIEGGAELGSSESLVGCLSDLQANYERLPILLEEHRGAQLGSCALEDGTNAELESEMPSEEATTHVPAPGQILAAFGEAGGGQERAKEEEGPKQFHRKKSRQSLEAAAPTIENERQKGANTTTTSSTSIVPKKPEEGEEEAVDEAQVPKVEFQCSQEAFSASQLAFSDESSQAQGVRFGLAESSHARLNFPREALPSQSNLSLSFQFRTSQRQGLLWAWQANYRNFTRFLLLHMDRGFLQLEMRHHRHPKTLHYKARRFNDGQWHRLELAKAGREVRLRVDDLPEEKLADAPNPKVTRKRMYIGGTIGRHRRKFREANEADGEELPPAFQGCIRHFQVDGLEQNLLLASRDLVPCADSPGVAYVHRGGFALFPSLNARHKKTAQKNGPKDGLELALRFRLLAEEMDEEELKEEESEGRGRLLLALMSPREEAFQQARLLLWVDDGGHGALGLSLHLARWRLQFQAVFDQSIVSSRNFSSQRPSPLSVCPGQWHNLRLALSTPGGISLTLDGQRVQLDLLHIPQGAVQELRSLPIQLGGTNAPTAASLGIRSLLGCAKQFELDGQAVELEMKAAKKWHKIVADGCPGA